MKAILESIECTWDIRQPYVVWLEHANQGLEMRGREFPEGDDFIPQRKVPGRSSVNVDINFMLCGNAELKKTEFAHKLMELLKEFEV